MRSWWLQAKALPGEIILQRVLVSELGAEAAGGWGRGLRGQGGRRKLRAQEGTVEAELGGTAGLWETQEGQGGWLGHWQL